MNTLRQALDEYLDMRRNLGFQLREAGKPYPISLPFWSTIVPPTSPRRWRWPGRNSQPALNPRIGPSA